MRFIPADTLSMLITFSGFVCRRKGGQGRTTAATSVEGRKEAADGFRASGTQRIKIESSVTYQVDLEFLDHQPLLHVIEARQFPAAAGRKAIRSRMEA